MTRESFYTCKIETVEQQFGLDSRPSTQPVARWLSPLLLLSRHHPEPTGKGTSVGRQTKLRRQIFGDSFPFDSAYSGIVSTRQELVGL